MRFPIWGSARASARTARGERHLGASTYACAGRDRIVCVYSAGGLGQLAELDLKDKVLRPLETPFTEFSSVRADRSNVVFRAGAPNHPASIVALDLTSGAHRVLKKETDLLDQSGLGIADYLSTVRPVEFSTTNGNSAYGLFYESPHKAAAEYNNVWREDLVDCFPIDAVEAVTDFSICERPRVANTSYLAFQDSATGGGQDSFALGIAHREGDNFVLDVLRERKPRFVAYEVIREWAFLLKSYGISEIHGDRYADQLFADEWAKYGIRAREPEHTTSENFLHGLPLVLGKRARLINNKTVRNQLVSLERRVVGDHEQVTHPSGGHDDVAAAAVGALVTAAQGSTYCLGPFQPDWVDLDRRTPAQEQPQEADADARQFLGTWDLSNNDAQPVQDMETMYRRYAEEISQAWKAPR